MERLKFLFGVIFCPPLQATQSELELFYQKSVKPFLTLTYRFPDVPLTLFFNGPFLEWLQDQHSEYLTALTEMIKRKQVEILGGGFFAPLLPLIPPTDRLGQIEELTTLVRKLLGRRPRGLWLTKAVWDPSLVVHLNGSGIEYTFLEEGDFRRVGISEDLLPYPRVTENQGRILNVVPFNSELSKKVWDGDFEAFRTEVSARSVRDDSLLAIFLPVESLKVGDFFTRGENGLKSFLELVRSLYPEMEGVNPASYFKKNLRPLERSYFGGTTYEELCRRTGLPVTPTAAQQSWRQFLTDFEPSNRLYSKMIYVHLLVSSLRGDKYKKKAAYEDLWRAQYSEAFFPERERAQPAATLRQKAFISLLNSEALLRDKTHFQSALTALDFDLDGVKEYLFQGKRFNFYVDAIGGHIFEWDCLEKPWNYVDGFEGNAEAPLPRIFVDRFYRIDQPEVDAGAFFRKEYKLVDLNREQKTIELWAVETLEGVQGLQPVRLKKAFSFLDDAVIVDYEFELLSGPQWEGWFSSESSLTFPVPDEVVSEVFGQEQESRGVRVLDSFRNLEMHWEWSLPASCRQEIHSSDERDGSSVYQAHRLIPRWWMILHPGEPWHCRISLLLK